MVPLVQPKLVLPAGASASGVADRNPRPLPRVLPVRQDRKPRPPTRALPVLPPPVPPGPQAAKPLTKEEAAQLSDMMRGVVTSGHAGFLADVPGAPVIAKTGTAEYGTELPLKTHAWIIAAQGDLAVAVFVETATTVPSVADRCSRPSLPVLPGSGSMRPGGLRPDGCL